MENLLKIICLYGKSLGPHCSFCHRAESHYVIQVEYDDDNVILICEDCLCCMNEEYRKSANKAAERMSGDLIT